jgi:hypothetical protein
MRVLARLGLGVRGYGALLLGQPGFSSHSYWSAVVSDHAVVVNLLTQIND